MSLLRVDMLGGITGCGHMHLKAPPPTPPPYIGDKSNSRGGILYLTLPRDSRERDATGISVSASEDIVSDSTRDLFCNILDMLTINISCTVASLGAVFLAH